MNDSPHLRCVHRSRRQRTIIGLLPLILLMTALGADDPCADPEKAKRISSDAQSTYIEWNRSGVKEPIPERFWAPEIRKPKPQAVYTHRVNLVVVQWATADVEEGLYIPLLISSYLPREGDDGFSFNPCPGSAENSLLVGKVIPYRRTLSSKIPPSAPAPKAPQASP